MPSDDVRIHPNLTDGSVVGIAQNLFEWMGEISPGVFIKAQAFKHADITTNQYTLVVRATEPSMLVWFKLCSTDRLGTFGY